MAIIPGTDYEEFPIPTADAEVNASDIRAAILSQSTDVGFLDRFDRSDRYTNGSTAVVHLTTMPEVGPVWRLNNTLPSSPPLITSGGLQPQADSLIYLSSSVPTPDAKFELGFDFEVAATSFPAGAFGLGLNISYSNQQMVSDAGTIAPNGVVHINFSSAGISSADIYPSTPLTCLNATSVAGSFPWRPGFTGLVPGRYTVLFKAQGDILEITLVGVGCLMFTHPDLSTKIGATTHFWWEPNGETLSGGQYQQIARLYRVWAQAEELTQLASFGSKESAPLRERVSTIPGLLRMTGSTGAAYPAGSSPSASDAFATPLRVKADQGFTSYPFANYAAYFAVLQGDGLTAQVSSGANDSNTNRMGLTDLPLAANGHSWEYVITGVFAANANNKAIQVWNSTAGAAILNSGTLTENGTPWVLTLRRHRNSTNSHVFVATLDTVGGRVVGRLVQNWGTLASSPQIRLTGVAAGDVVIETRRFQLNIT
jgi:hypothetical protein